MNNILFLVGVLSALPGSQASTCSIKHDTAMSLQFYKNVKISQIECCSLCASDSVCRTAVYSPRGECHLHDAWDRHRAFTDPGWMLMIPAPQPKENIVQLAEHTAVLSTLVSAVVAADLADTLSSAGKFTVFAPTNEAFKALPPGTLDNLMKPENKAKLVDILKYHVLPEEVLSTQLKASQVVTTLEGKKVTVTKVDGKVRVGSPPKNVIKADNLASNGVVHIIDGVLLPGSAPAPAPPTPPKQQNIVQLAEQTEDLSILVSAMVAAELTDTLSSAGKFTVFAPTDEAFKALPKGTLDSLMKPENKAKLVDILKYHVLPEEVLSTQLKPFPAVPTVEGKLLHVTEWNGQVRVGPGLLSKDLKNVIKADNIASNGVVHIINGVLLPPSSSDTVQSTASMTIV